MVTKIFARLKTGSIKNVAVFGASQLPASPYVVIKQRKDALNRGIVFEIFAHRKPDEQLLLEDYVRQELPELLDNFQATTRNGNIKILEMLEGSTSVTPMLNDDNTISMERSFLSPSPITF